MDQNDQRDYVEEAANRALMHEEEYSDLPDGPVFSGLAAACAPKPKADISAATVSITIWPGTRHHLTFKWEETGTLFMCYLLMPGVNNWAKFPLFNTQGMSAALATISDIYTDTAKMDNSDERAQYKRDNMNLAI